MATVATNPVITAFTTFFSSHGSTLFNVILIVSTVGGQSILRKFTFSCPCAYPLNIFHSLVIVLGPTIALFLIGVMLNSSTWQLLHGSCFRYYRCSSAHRYCPLKTAILCKNETLMAELNQSPSYESATGHGLYCPFCICEMSNADGVLLDAESQILAFSLLIAYGLATMCAICIFRMCDKYTLVQHHYVEMYKEEEKSKFDQIARDHASQIAERNARAFFNQSNWSKRDWDWVSGVPEINNPFFARLRIIASENTQMAIYTPLQLWNDHKGYRILKPDILYATEEKGILLPQERRMESEK